MSAPDDARRRRWVAIAATIVALGLGAAGAMTAAAGDDGAPTRARAEGARAAVTTTASETVVVRRTDRRRGLVFELESSPRYGDSALFV